uniref:hypothetical protein n=1 Tax=Scandinavium goeteborgense TaxID=1851514 RepID=UPI0013591FC6|nr:hypothetical protein [Scandinavium goeteborgense]
MTVHFSPSDKPVEYTIEQMSSVPPETWHTFISAVLNLYYTLPFGFRPVRPETDSRRAALDLFRPYENSRVDASDELVFSGMKEDGYRHRIITIGSKRTRDELSVDIIETEFQMSSDLFTRLVMLALHNICGEHFIVHSTAGARSWAMPLALLKSSCNADRLAGWEAPDVMHYSSLFGEENARLTEQAIVNNLTMSPAIDLSQAQWEDIVALEFRLYDESPSRREIARSVDPEAVLVDITLCTSSSGRLLVELRDFEVLLHWASLNIPAYENGVPDGEPVFLSRNHLALLRDDVRNGQLSSFAGNRTYGETFYSELQLIALWAEHCIHTLDFEREEAFFIAVW